MGWISRLAISCTTIAAGAALLTVTSGCNEHRVSFATASGAVEHLEKRNLSGGEKIDLLWVIDNSGSMCRSQEVLRNGIEEFVRILGEVNLDFQIGITTTHMVDCEGVDTETNPWHPCALEPVALAGHLQSTPQPVPGFDEACYHPVDENGMPIPGQYDPVIENVQVAVNCTENPDDYQHLLNFNAQWEENFRCAVDRTIDGDDCTGAPDLEDLFPNPADYRDIPVVLRASDYDTIEEFAEDFRCASLVGTRGYGYEMGLLAAVTAVSEDLIGDQPYEEGDEVDLEAHPNAGFIRKDAMTGLIFVGDENDCSHDGTLDTGTQCGVNNCTIQEELGEEGALLSIDELYDMFIENLADARGTDAATLKENNSTILPASFHARYRKASNVPEACPTGGWDVPPSCASEMGFGWSGHRFDYFLDKFDTHFPSRDGDEPLEGLICTQEQFERGLEELAEFFTAEAGACYQDVYTCSGFNDHCPSSPYDPDAPGHCLPDPGHHNNVLNIVQSGGVDGLDAAIAELDAFYEEDLNSAADLAPRHVDELLRRLPGGALATIESGLGDANFYCDTGIEVRIGIPDESELGTDFLEGTGYCLEGTIDSDPAFPDTCVVDPDFYWWSECGGTNNGLQLAWVEAQEWIHAIGGLDLYTRYATIPGADGADGGDDNGDDNGEE